MHMYQKKEKKETLFLSLIIVGHAGNVNCVSFEKYNSWAEKSLNNLDDHLNIEDKLPMC